MLICVLLFISFFFVQCIFPNRMIFFKAATTQSSKHWAVEGLEPRYTFALQITLKSFSEIIIRFFQIFFLYIYIYFQTIDWYKKLEAIYSPEKPYFFVELFNVKSPQILLITGLFFFIRVFHVSNFLAFFLDPQNEFTWNSRGCSGPHVSKITWKLLGKAFISQKGLPCYYNFNAKYQLLSS